LKFFTFTFRLLSQEQVAKKIHTTKSVVSRIENHAEDIKLSTLDKFAKALNKKVHISILWQTY